MSDFSLRGPQWTVKVRHRDSGKVFVVNVFASTKELAAKWAINQTVRDHGFSRLAYTTLTIKEWQPS